MRDAYWLDGSAYCPGCVECSTPALSPAEIARAGREPGSGLCACCGKEFPRWREISRNAFEEQAPRGRWVWAHDGVNGFAREMDEGETLADVLADFEAAGEDAVTVRIYEDGESAV